MTTQEQIALCDTAIHANMLLRASLSGVPPSDVIHVRAGESIQAAMDSAPDGATISIEPATYDEALTVRKSVQLTASTPLRHGRAGRNASVWLTSRAEATILVTGAGITIAGLGITNQEQSYDAVDIYGSRVLFDRCSVVGSPDHGMRRGWLTHGDTIKITGCHADDVWNMGRDTCVVGGWEGGSNILVDDCFLCGGAETILYGGADCSSPEKIPHHITITHSTLTHNPDWYARGIDIKTPFELKCCQHVYMADCLLEWAGVAGGQGAYLLLLTVRNQDGNARWATITDILIERCHFRHGGGGINFLGYDDTYESGPLANVTINNCAFTGMNPAGPWSEASGYYGSGRCTMFNNQGEGITLDAITMDGQNMGALANFANTPKQPIGLILRNWKYCQTEYGWKIDDGGMDVPPAHTNISALMPDMIYEVTANDPGAVGYPESGHHR